MRHKDIFQQSGIPCHKSKLKICVLSDWSNQSPDLNITEQMLADLKARIASFRPDSMETLWITTEKQLAMIKTSEIKNLYERVLRRI